MTYEIKNAKITHVSLVDKGANGRQFAIVKSDQKPNIEKRVPILKTDEERRLVTGVVYEPDTVDAHGDMMTAEEIEKTAHLFMKEYQQIDKQHNWEDGYGTVVESWVTKSDTYIGDQEVKKGSWCMTVYVEDDDTWEEIKKGEVTGFSMGGVGERVEIEKKQNITDEEKGFIRKMMEFFKQHNIQKAELKDQFNSDFLESNIRSAYYKFDDLFWEEIWKMYPDFERLTVALQDFQDIVNFLKSNEIVVKNEDLQKTAEEMLVNRIEKAGKILSAKNLTRLQQAIDLLTEIKDEAETEGDEEEVTKEELAQVVKEAISPIAEKVEKLEKSINGEEQVPQENQQEENDVIKTLSEVIRKELEPLSKRVEDLEKAKGIRKSIEGQDVLKQQEQPKSIWAGLNL